MHRKPPSTRLTPGCTDDIGHRQVRLKDHVDVDPPRTTHERSATLLPTHEPASLQIGNRTTDGGATDPEFVGELRFSGHALPLDVHTVDDAALELPSYRLNPQH